jgi:demethylmenaquinone methyltransferase/2-methoxy-6-polyprenyl-1,4-benzoquinol methylase
MNQKLHTIDSITLQDSEQKRAYNRKLFSIVAQKYDQITRLMSLDKDRSWKKYLLSKIKSTHKNAVVLDIASGTGDIVFNVRSKFPDATIIASDISLEMLLAGKLKNRSSHILCSDMCKLPFNDSSVDITTGCYALRNAPDLNMALNEIYRVLKPHGRAYILDFSLYNNRILQKLEIIILYFWGSFLGLLFHKNPAIYAYIAKSLSTFPNRKKLNQMITRCNFKLIEEKLFFLHFISFLIIEKE